jgi:CRP/FNR family transcriptional regulator, cyclic AMP receptor protein
MRSDPTAVDPGTAQRCSVTAIVARTPMLRGLSEDILDQVTRTMSMVEVARHAVIFGQGERDDRAYVLVAGRVKLTRSSGPDKDTLLAVLAPGDLFGEIQALDPGPRTSTATAQTPVRVAVIERADLCRLLAAHPGLAANLLRILARRQRRLEATLADMVFTDVPGRIAKALLHLAQRFGRDQDGTLFVDHGLTQVEIAQYVGTSRETVNKVLRTFAHRGWLRLSGKKLRIEQPESLARRAG